MISTLKHYTAYNQDFGRIGFDTDVPGVNTPGVNVVVSERALQEIYEAPFRTAVQVGGVDSVMCSYNQINGMPSCENPTTLGDLKQGDGFKGFVVPDFGFAVRESDRGRERRRRPRRASRGAQWPHARGLHLGQISASRLDDMARRILFAMFDSGVFDNPLPTPSTEVSTPAHQQVATQVAEAGTVLLKNDRGALPALAGTTARSR